MTTAHTATHTGDDNAWIGDSTLGERFPAWTRGNAADVFPEPFSPLGKSMVLQEALSPGLRDAYIDLGALSYDEFENPDAPDLFKMFGGYVYNPLTLTRILGARMPGASPEMIDKAFFDERDEVPPYEEQPWHVSEIHEARLGESMAWAMSTQSLPELDADRALARSLREHRPDLGSLTDSALLARARAMIPYLQQTMENAMRVSSVGSLGPGALGAICEGLGDPTLSIRLLAGIDVDSAAPSHAMWELGRVAAASDVIAAAFDAGPDEVLDRLRASDSADAKDFLDRFDQFLFDHGARGQNEYDVYAISWEVKPRIALAAIDLMRRSDASQAPTNRNTAAIAERDRIAADIRARIADDPETAGLFEAAMGLGATLPERTRARQDQRRDRHQRDPRCASRVRTPTRRARRDRRDRPGLHGHRRRAQPAASRARIHGRSDPRSLGHLPVALRLRAGVRRQWCGPGTLRHASTRRRDARQPRSWAPS